MIATFDVITEHGTGDPKLLSGGISEALVTTELGLIVAIPTLLIGSLLASRVDAVMSGIERSALKMMNTLAVLQASPVRETVVRTPEYSGGGTVKESAGTVKEPSGPTPEMAVNLGGAAS